MDCVTACGSGIRMENIICKLKSKKNQNPSEQIRPKCIDLPISGFRILQAVTQHGIWTSTAPLRQPVSSPLLPLTHGMAQRRGLVRVGIEWSREAKREGQMRESRLKSVGQVSKIPNSFRESI